MSLVAQLVSRLLLGTAVFVALSAQSAQALHWELRAPFLDPRTGSGVEGAAASLIGNRIYVSHGFRNGDSAFLSVYNIFTDSWTHGGSTAPDAAVARSEMCSGVALGRHYAIGGRTGPNADNEEFDPVGISWTPRTSMSVARGGLGCASFADKIYAVGGRDGGSFGGGTILALNEVYDAVGNSWSTKASMPVAVSDHYATVALDGKVYVFGGATDPLTVINTVQIYDISGDSWSFGTPMPTARGAAMVGIIGAQIAVFGGYDPSAGGNLGVTELYDPLTDTWSTGPDMVVPSSEFAQGVTSNGSAVFAIGSGIFGASSPVVQVLVPERNLAPALSPLGLAIATVMLLGLGCLRLWASGARFGRDTRLSIDSLR